jgi:hypothetical protein
VRSLRIPAFVSLATVVAFGQDAPPPAPDLPPRLVGPRAGPERVKALQRHGGNDATEKAVAAGLDWLARHQDEDGGWDADGFDARCAGKACDGKGRGQHGEDTPCPFDDAVSALALLAFLGSGHLPDAPGDPYGAVVAKAVRRVEGTRDTWAIPIATEALAELEAMERKGLRRDAVRANVEALVAARSEDGAWGYFPGMGRGSDVPYTALVVPALVAARDAGAALPDDLGKRVDAWLASLEEKEGKLAYVINGRAFGYTPTSSNAHCALAIRELLQAGTSGPRHRAHAAHVAGEPPVWKISFREMEVDGRGKVQVQIGSLSMYAWWYGTVGSFQRGGDAWTSWFGATRTALLGHQRKDGCAKGSWDPAGWYERRTGGRVFATALGVLMLEQPYRHRRLRA